MFSFHFLAFHEFFRLSKDDKRAATWIDERKIKFVNL
jgi:hypothetical protein